jgi:hypothetical protein
VNFQLGRGEALSSGVKCRELQVAGGEHIFIACAARRVSYS